MFIGLKEITLLIKSNNNRTMSSSIKKAFEKKVDGSGLAIFRVAYCLVLFTEVIHLYSTRHLVYDNIPFIQPYEIDLSLPLIIWAIVVFFLMIGLFSRLASIINYILSLVLIGTITSFEYHMFYVYMGINFLIMFLPINIKFSVDQLINKLKYSNTKFQFKPETNVRQLYYFAPLLIAVGLVYIDSVFYKLSSPMWRSGLGVWLPSSLPMISISDKTWLLNNEFLVKFTGYLTIVFEGVFIFTFFRKKWRLPLIILGLLLHIGILLEFPIPQFALGMCSFYILMVPISIWKKLLNRTNLNETPNLKVYYDSECPLCIRTKLTVEHLDNFNRILFLPVQTEAVNESCLSDYSENELLENIFSVNKNGKVFSGLDTYLQIFKSIWYLYPLYLLISLPGIKQIAAKIYSIVAKNRATTRCTEENCGYTPPVYNKTEDIKLMNNLNWHNVQLSLWTFFLVFCISLQSMYIIRTISKMPFYSSIEQKIGFPAQAPVIIAKKIIKLTSPYSKQLLGLTAHPVFMDGHFKNYNHIVNVAYFQKDNSEINLPIMTDKGNPSRFNKSFVWVNWTFRVNGPNINQDHLENGIKDYTAFWAKKNGVDLTNAKFEILVKKVDVPSEWSRNFILEQESHPWISGGFVEWKDGQFYPNIKIIEDL